MFRRKLSALDYHNPAGFNCRDETEFRNFIVWLEDQKIRHYKIEDRGNLRNIHSDDWPKSFEKYMKDVNCPFKIQERQETVDWLLGLAVRLEYGDNADKYKDSTPDGAKNTDNTAKNAEPLINLDVNNPDFKAGVMALANLLQIQRHDDYLVMLKAIRILVQERLTQDAIAKASQSKEGLPVALEKHILGFDTGDAVLNEAAQILRLLHIEELRELQTKINEAIVAVQADLTEGKRSSSCVFLGDSRPGMGLCSPRHVPRRLGDGGGGGRQGQPWSHAGTCPLDLPSLATWGRAATNPAGRDVWLRQPLGSRIW
uniref:RNA transcription, translation and transport factor protein n=4 Tax=Aves TaxID=8782 RepID=A0A663E0Y0_AQUCH